MRIDEETGDVTIEMEFLGQPVEYTFNILEALEIEVNGGEIPETSIEDGNLIVMTDEETVEIPLSELQ